MIVIVLTKEEKALLQAGLTLYNEMEIKEWEVKTSNGRYDPYGKPDNQSIIQLRNKLMEAGNA